MAPREASCAIAVSTAKTKQPRKRRSMAIRNRKETFMAFELNACITTVFAEST
jgi:hypothetical protein